MYRVLIVDDEPIICEGLTKSVRWADFGCEVVGTASNGMEGLQCVRTLQPDILISDIAMTNMDGLSMVAAIVSEYPDIEVTLLTGYRNFEYAQRAIRLGVTRFLLKPSKMDEIEEAIEAMTANLRKRGNFGTQILDEVWDMRREEDRYLYETFILGRPSGEEEGDGKGPSKMKSSQANLFILKKALLFMLRESARKLGLGEVADHCYVSSWHLSKLLNQYTRRGFFEILNIIRVDRAKELLLSTDRKVQDISEEVGFQDVAHFSRIFKNQVGTSPKEYRLKEGKEPSG